jgi:hypothetical protein
LWKLFCARCIALFFPPRCWSYLLWLHRYLPGMFDYAQKRDKNCPFCQGCCNCTAYCRKRGDTYVSSVGAKKTMATQPLALRQCASLGRKINLPPPSQLPSEPVKYWGAVYSGLGRKSQTSSLLRRRRVTQRWFLVYPALVKELLLSRRTATAEKRIRWGYATSLGL